MNVAICAQELEEEEAAAEDSLVENLGLQLQEAHHRLQVRDDLAFGRILHAWVMRYFFFFFYEHSRICIHL